jgi:hypothetical protein
VVRIHSPRPISSVHLTIQARGDLPRSRFAFLCVSFAGLRAPRLPLRTVPLSLRSKLSLAQLLALLSPDLLALLFKKHGLNWPSHVQPLQWLTEVLSKVDEPRLASLTEETLRTSGTLRASYTGSKWHFDERLQDFRVCAALDGYHVMPSDGYNAKGYKLVPVEPSLPGADAVEDDLTSALKTSKLPETDDILALLEKSAAAFTAHPPDYNACLAEARAALETLGIAIAKARGGTTLVWGDSLAFLRTSGLVTVEEEKGIAGVYRFVSPGAHKHVALDEQEMTRLGRSLVISMIYFLLKEHNG